MIRLERRLAGVPAGLKGSRRATKARRLITEFCNGGTIDFVSKYWSDAKENLLAESQGKCAYCEASFRHVAYGDIEHFRPKSIYWWLAYCYLNFAASCQLCNQGDAKGDKFELAPGKRRLRSPRVPSNWSSLTEAEQTSAATQLFPDPVDPEDEEAREAYLKRCIKEGALLVDPYNPDDPDPEDLFSWDVREPLQEVHVVARSGGPKARARYAIETLKLNRDELLKARFSEFRTLRSAAALLLARPNLTALGAVFAPVPADNRALLQDIRDGKHEYTAMARHFFKAWGLIP